MDAQATFSCSFTQSDLSPVAEPPGLPHWPAQRLLPQQRQDLAVQVLAGAQPVSDLARDMRSAASSSTSKPTPPVMR